MTANERLMEVAHRTSVFDKHPHSGEGGRTPAMRRHCRATTNQRQFGAEHTRRACQSLKERADDTESDHAVAKGRNDLAAHRATA